MNFARSLACAAVIVMVAGHGAAAASAVDAARTAAVGNLDAGIAAYEAHDYRQAVKELESAIVADPKDPEGYFRLGQSHRALGNYRSALKYIRLTLEIEPNHLAALRERGVTLLEAGQTEDAKVALDRLGDKCNRACPEYVSLKQALDSQPTKKDS